MFNFFKYTKKNETIDNKSKVVQQNFLSTTTDIIELSQDIIYSLKNKINDYVNQINSISEILSDALILVDDVGCIKNLNNSALLLFGYFEKDLIDYNLSKIFDIQKNINMDELYLMVRKPNKHQYENFRGVKSSGEKIFIDISANKIIKIDKSYYYVMIIRDVTLRVKNDQKIIESEQRFRSFGETSSDGMLIHSSEKILDWNPKFSEIIGYNNNEISSMRPEDFIHPIGKELYLKLDNSTILEHYETILLCKNGDMLDVSINSKPVLWKGKDARIKVLRDISNYKETEKKLRSSKEKYKTIIDNTIDLVCCFSVDLYITFSNQTFCEYFGIDAHNCVGRSIFDFMVPDDHPDLLTNLKEISITTPVIRHLYREKVGNENRWQVWIK